MSKPKESDLKKLISDYMMDQNRPFSANDILNNMHLDCGKSAFTRALDLLVSEGKVKEKTYGKQKIYFVNQDLFNDSETTDFQSIEDKITELTNIYNKMQKELRNLEIKLGDLEKTPTTDEAEEELRAIKAEIPLFEDQLKALESKAGSIEPGELEALLEEEEKVMKEYQRRKRITNKIIDAILEEYPTSRKQLLEEIGIEETDDDLKLFE